MVIFCPFCLQGSSTSLHWVIPFWAPVWLACPRAPGSAEEDLGGERACQGCAGPRGMSSKWGIGWSSTERRPDWFSWRHKGPRKGGMTNKLTNVSSNPAKRSYWSYRHCSANYWQSGRARLKSVGEWVLPPMKYCTQGGENQSKVARQPAGKTP